MSTLFKNPIISVGQLYLNETLNEYIVVTKNDKGYISYAGTTCCGKLEGENFIEAFPPVDPLDLSDSEKDMLLSLFNGTVELKIGYLS